MRASSFLGARLAAALLLLVTLTGVGCSSTPELGIEITSTEETNGGRPFYAVVRSVEQAEYITDSYEGIADMIFAKPLDKSILRAEVIYPGVDSEWTVEPPKDLSIGVYFLFTDPGDGWKVIRPAPLPSSFAIKLGVNAVTSVE